MKAGDKALSRDGHPVQILRTWTEEEVEFAEVVYLDGHMPYPHVNGRLGGTPDEPTWEHRIKDGRVLKSGGNYWNDEDWTVEKGLRPLGDRYLDEYTNDELPAALEGEFKGTPAVRAELKRVNDFIEARVMTGEDLSYWIERGRMLERAVAGQARKVEELTTDELQDIVIRANSRTGGPLTWSARTKDAFRELERRGSCQA